MPKTWNRVGTITKILIYEKIIASFILLHKHLFVDVNVLFWPAKS